MFTKIEMLGDRLLSRLVPRVQASAACTPRKYYKVCYCYYCGPGVQCTAMKLCYLSSSCHLTCGPCEGGWIGYGC